MLTWLRLSHHQHSGKLRSHEHTSYISLGIILSVAGFTLIATTVYAAEHPEPQAGSIGLTGTMPGSPPTVAATINIPNDKDRFDESPVEVSGTCPEDTLVEVFKNNIFAGSTVCTDAGIYTISIDLLVGKNTIIARVYDALNQAGPDSNSIAIYYDALPAQSAALSTLSFDDNQLLLNTDAVYRGTFPNQELNIPIDILGGSPPYAVNIQWGDSNNKVVSRNDNTSFNVGHTYLKAGTFQISIQATDMEGRVAFLTVASIVNGQVASTTSSNSDTSSSTLSSRLAVLWPLYVGAVAVVISFFVGEKREKNVLKKHGLLTTPENA